MGGIYSTPLQEQAATKSLEGFEFRVFSSPRLVTIPMIKNPVSASIYP